MAIPEERGKQIERRKPGDLSRRLETSRRGTDAAAYVACLAKAGSGLSSEVSANRQGLRDPGAIGL